MNNDTRATLKTLTAAIEAIKMQVAELQEQCNDAANNEREKFDNMPEGLQDSDRGQAIDQAATELEGAHEELEGAFTALDAAIDAINNAIGE